MNRRRFLATAAGAFSSGPVLLKSSGAAAQARSSSAPVSITVNAVKIPSFDLRDPSHIRVGMLEFRSGLVLTSPFKEFGGLSGLRLDAKGERFLALSDKGDWFTGRLVYAGKELVGLDNVESSPMLGSDGRKITSRGWFDTEALALDGDFVYVGLERVNQILRFDFSKGGIRSLGQVVPVPPEIGKFPFNKGIESLVFVPKGLKLAGTLIVISERALDGDGNIKGCLIGGPKPGFFAVKRTDNFDISDAVLLPSGQLLLLERKFSILEGVRIRIRRVALDALVSDALVDGPSIFEVDLGYEIDNMEGIDAHVTETGETILTMVSDDNFSVLQRTLLLQFALIEE